MKNTLRTSFRLIVSQILVFIIYSLGKGNLMNVLLYGQLAELFWVGHSENNNKNSKFKGEHI